MNRIAFKLEPLKQFQPIEIIIDFLLMLDILLNFITSNKMKGVIMTSNKEIAIQYLKGGFMFDMLSVVPSLVVGNRFQNPKCYYFKLVRYI